MGKTENEFRVICSRNRGMTSLRCCGAAAVAAGILIGLFAPTACIAQTPFLHDEDVLAWRESKFAELQEIAPQWHFRLDAEGFSRGSGSHEAMYGPTVTQTDFLRLAKHLNLSAEQQGAAAEIYRQRLTNFMDQAKPLLAAATDLTAAMARMWQGGDGPEASHWIRFELAVRTIAAEQRVMRLGVMDDLKALLLAHQEPLWPRAESELRRVRFMRSGEASLSEGVGIDIRALVTEAIGRMAAAPPPESVGRINEILDAYDLEADAIFQKACRADDEAVAVILAKPESPERVAAVSTRHSALLRLLEQFRKLNDRTMQQVAGLLGDDAGADLLVEFHQRAFASVYRETHGERTLSAAMKLPDLDAEQRQRIAELQTGHAATMAELRGRSVKQIVAMAKFQVDVLSDDPNVVQAALQHNPAIFTEPHYGLEMNKADLLAIKRVRALLSPEQRTKLPRRVMLDLPGVETRAGD